MKKYCVLSIAILALFHPADAHTHHHRDRQISRRAIHPDSAAQECSKATLTDTVIVRIDQSGNTVGVEVQSARPSMTVTSIDHRKSVELSLGQTATNTASASHDNEQFSSLTTSLPTSAKAISVSSSSSSSASSASPSSPSTASSSSRPLSSKVLQNDRYIVPQPTALDHLPNPLDSNFVPEASNNLVGRRKYGISYSPYKRGGCKGQEEVDQDIRQLRQFSFVRFYGIDCNQAETITKAARKNNMMVFAGLYDIDNIDEDVEKIINAADGDWSTFHTVSVGNELVNRGQKSPAEVVEAVNSARGILRQAGYQGPVVTVDTSSQMIAHPELCDGSDYCAANCHAFFDATQTPENAGPYVLEQARHVSEASKEGKEVIITETGWPSAGEPNGAAVPSPQNQRIALKSLEESFPDGGLVFFSAFDDDWKEDNAWTFGTEQHWGLLGLTQSTGGLPSLTNPLDDGM